MLQFTSITDIPKVVAASKAQFETGSNLPLPARRDAIRTILRLVRENKDAVFTAISADKGNPKLEMMFEILPLFQEAKLAIDNLESWAAPKKAPFNLLYVADERRHQPEPVGTVLVIAPWNYPFMLALQPCIAAIAAGCTVVLKPSEVAVNTAELLGRLIPKYFPTGLISVVQGGVAETTALLEQKFDHIFYTGNSAVGSIIMKAASKYLTPVTLELGGKCPAIVLPDADIENTAHRIVWGKFMNCGQTCVAPDYILVHPSIREKFVDAARRCVFEFYGNDPRSVDNFARVINPHHHSRLRKLLEEQLAINPKSEVVTGGVFGVDDPKNYFPPTIVDNVGLDAGKNPLMRGEIFGPILPLLRRPLRMLEHPLAIYAFSAEPKKAAAALSGCTKSGAVTVNDVIVHVGMCDMPFGGVGQSGMGVYHGEYGFRTFSVDRTYVVRSMGFEFLHSALYPPNMGSSLKQLESMMVDPPSENTLTVRKVTKAIGGWLVTGAFVAAVVAVAVNRKVLLA
ncbi:Aldehyde/histidinol dehydrogenase [Chytridium lagenaria]|nr:Aldehyde/histidinol dehydrogenase [Chytridium lagenaria]